MREAVDDGRLDPKRLENRRALEKELDWLDRDVAERRRFERSLGKHYKSVMSEKQGRRRGG